MSQSKQFSDIYRALFNKYKAQGWWPITIDGKSIYGVDAPRNEKDAFEIIVGTILTQNTSWKNVEKALINLKSSGNLDLKKINDIQLGELEKLINPSGFYRQKALSIKEFCSFILSFGSFEKFEKKITRELLLEQKGIGPETADSIMLYALRKTEFVVDAYTKRIFSRIGVIKKDEKYEDMKKVFEENIPKDLEIYNEYHALIIEHAKQFCQKKPLCNNCPLNKICKKNT